MLTNSLLRAVGLVLVMFMAAACAKTQTGANPFRHHSPYSALQYVDSNKVNVLATGELQYTK